MRREVNKVLVPELMQRFGHVFLVRPDPLSYLAMCWRRVPVLVAAGDDMCHPSDQVAAQQLVSQLNRQRFLSLPDLGYPFSYPLHHAAKGAHLLPRPVQHFGGWGGLDAWPVRLVLALSANSEDITGTAAVLEIDDHVPWDAHKAMYASTEHQVQARARIAAGQLLASPVASLLRPLSDVLKRLALKAPPQDTLPQ